MEENDNLRQQIDELESARICLASLLDIGLQDESSRRDNGKNGPSECKVLVHPNMVFPLSNVLTPL